MFGIVKPYKGYEVILKAISLLPIKLTKDIQLLIAGSGDEIIKPYKKLAEELNINRLVSWDIRFIPEEEIPTLFNNAIIVAMPYLDIDQSGVMMTALGYKKPIIASNIGGFAETIKHGVHGYLVEPNNPKELSIYLEKMINDNILLENMSNSIKELIEQKYSWDNIAAETVAVYTSICKGGS
jgi:glycosyltransferase involved in cell wall biosynthesis